MKSRSAELTPGSLPVYRFADLVLDTGQRRLERAGEPIEFGRLTYATLVALVESAPNVLGHDDLVARVWAGRATSAETVTQRIKLLRDALSDSAERPRYIGLVRGQGYRLIPPVDRLHDSLAPVVSPPHGATAFLARGRVATVALAVGLVLLTIVATYFASTRLGAGGGIARSGGSLDFEISQLTTTGKAVMPAISPDGRYVVYAETDAHRLPTSLWVRQVGTASNAQVVRAEPRTFVGAPTVSPDGNFIDYVKIPPAGVGELWRVPLLGGTPHLLKRVAESPVGWSPDGTRGAFIRNDIALAKTSLVTFDGAGAERMLAPRTGPTYWASLRTVGIPPVRPSWSPDGATIALAEYTDIFAPRIAVVDYATGKETIRDSQGGFHVQGVGWLGPSTLVLSQPAAYGQRSQLWRMTYAGGIVTPLTNDLSSYIGIDLDASRTRLVTSRRDVRTSVWLADATGDNAVQLVPPTPFGGANVLLSWAGERLLYDATLNGRPAIAELTPGDTTVNEVVDDAFHVAAAPSEGTIVFSSAARGRAGLWKLDPSRQQRVRLVSGVALEPVVTPDRAVVFLSTRSGVQSPWIVPLDGGDATEIIREMVPALAFDVSPDGRWLAFFTMPRTAIFLCELPRCSNRHSVPAPANFSPGPLRWTPDGTALAYVATPGTDIWAAPVDGSPPHAVTGGAPDADRIAAFRWSRDGSRLAFVRWSQEDDVVMLTGLRP